MKQRILVLLLVAALAWGTTPALAQSTTYTVRGGDTLASIAARFDVSLEALLVANGLTNPNTVFAGQVLTIPSGTTPGFGTGGPLAPQQPADVVVAPGLQSPQVQPGAAELRPTYTVRTGDTLGAIAAAFGVTPESIALLNGLANINIVQAGRILVLPQGSEFGTGGPIQQPRTYTVQAGDVLSLIALEFGTTPEAIAEVNDLGNPSRIFPGEVLIIP